MGKVTVSPKFQVVIPKEIRQKSGLKAGSSLEVIYYDGRIELIPLNPIREMIGYLKGIDTSIERTDDRF